MKKENDREGGRDHPVFLFRMSCAYIAAAVRTAVVKPYLDTKMFTAVGAGPLV